MTHGRARARLGVVAAGIVLGVTCGTLRGLTTIAQPPPDDGPAVPEPVGFVNDVAGVMDERSRTRLEAFLDQLRRKTGAEFAILTLRSTAPATPSEFKVRVFERWGLGERGKDNGLLMLVALEEREVRFETGYGLEGTLPDGLQSRIFRYEMRPRFAEDDYSGGIIAGALACAARIGAEQGVSLEWDGRELRYNRPGPSRGPPFWALLLIVGLLLLFGISGSYAATPRGGRRRWRRGGWHSGWPGGWGGGFGGGFGGGGFGGGGFGGFGGGASGGGGGGGSW